MGSVSEGDLRALAEYALSVAGRLGAEYAEAYLEDSYSDSVAVEQGLANGSAHSTDKGIRLRMIKKGMLYSFSTNDLSKPSISAMAGRQAPFSGRKTSLSEEPRARARIAVREKEKLEDGNLLKDLLFLDRDASKIKYLRFKSFYGSTGRTKDYFLNSEGSEVISEVPYVNIFAVITVAHGSETRQRYLNIGGTGGYELFGKEDVSEQIADESKRLHEVLEKGINLPRQELRSIRNVVISPEICGIAVHESVGHANEADRIFGREAAQAGTSYLSESNLGSRVASECVTILDDPSVKGSYGFLGYDDEGVKAKAKKIVESGMQNELLLNREFAAALGRSSNGSSRSDSYSNEPLIRMSNTYLLPGRCSLDELMQEAGKGVYLRSYTEWNIDDTRSFARYQGNEAYLISKGGQEKPVKNYLLEARTSDFWNAVRLVANDLSLYMGSCGKGEPLQGMPVTMGGPHMLLSFK